MLRNSVLFLSLVSCSLISGCSDYLNNLDTVTLEAGDTQSHNRLLHVDKPFNPDGTNVVIKSDGRRVADTVEVYKSGLSKAPVE